MIVIGTLLVDIFVLKMYGFGLNLYTFSTAQKQLIFVILAVSGIAGQFFIIQYVESRATNYKMRSVGYTANLRKFFKIFQYSMIVMLLFIISEILIEGQYRTVLLIGITSISYIVMIVMLGTLSFRFFTWFKSHRNYINFDGLRGFIVNG